MNKEVNSEVQKSLKDMSNRTTKFICKVYGTGLESIEININEKNSILYFS